MSIDSYLAPLNRHGRSLKRRINKSACLPFSDRAARIVFYLAVVIGIALFSGTPVFA